MLPEKYIGIKYKNRKPWKPNSLLKSFKRNHSLYKLSIIKPTDINKSIYNKKYINKVNSIKRKAERDHFSNQLEIDKSDMKKSWNIMSPRGTVCMTHRRVDILWYLLIQSSVALQVDAYRIRLGEGNSEIKPHSSSYGSNSLTVLRGLGIMKG